MRAVRTPGLLTPLVLLLARRRPTETRLSLLDAREAGAHTIIEALYGEVSSSQAFARQAVAANEVEAKHRSRSRELTYGEFDLAFFYRLLRAAHPEPGEYFVDIGSGVGRLVVAAALVHDWRFAAGIEILEELHGLGARTHGRLLAEAGGDDGVWLAPCRFLCQEAEVALPQLAPEGSAGGRGVAFVYATCWPSVGPYLAELSRSLAATLPSGSRVITIDKQLVSDGGAAAAVGAPPGDSCWTFRLLHDEEAANYNTHRSRGYVYELQRHDETVSGTTLDGQLNF